MKDSIVMDISSDIIIQKLNKVLIGEEMNLINKFTAPKLPVIFIVGAPRSGTTLLEQLIINHFQLTYINNIVAKFWEAPFVGLHFYKSLKKKQTKTNYTSDLGFTENHDGPHEFGYFWKRFFKYGSTDQLTLQQHDEINSSLLNKEISAMESVDNLPVLFKNPAALSLQVDYLSRHVSRALFVYVKRDPAFNAQSIYQSRTRYFGDVEKWFSVKPKEYLFLKEQDIYEQIAGQIFYVNKKIEEDLKNLDPIKYLEIAYEDLCLNTKRFLMLFKEWLEKNNYDIKDKITHTDDRFQHTNQVVIDKEIFEKLKSSCSHYTSNL